MALVDRVKNILLTPQTEWPKIAAEESNVQSIMTGYVLILAAIGPIALAIRFMSLGIVAAVVTYIVSLVSLFVFAWIVDMLASNFGGEKNFLQSFKLVAYSMTASWIAGIFKLLPYLGGLVALLGAHLYAVYVLPRRANAQEMRSGQSGRLHDRCHRLRNRARVTDRLRADADVRGRRDGRTRDDAVTELHERAPPEATAPPRRRRAPSVVVLASRRDRSRTPARSGAPLPKSRWRRVCGRMCR